MAKRSFLDDQSGSVAPTFALAMLGLIAIAGVGFDYARLAAMDSELQNAADQAALAAATQLDGKSNAIARATAAASSLVVNTAKFANDGGGQATTIASLTFYESYDSASDTLGAVTVVDSEATVVRVILDNREAFYALTPIVGAISSGEIEAQALAGLGTAICKVPPLMICNPNEAAGGNFPALDGSDRGKGLKLEAGGGGAWAPGNYGYLDFGGGAHDLSEALGADGNIDDCVDAAALRTKTGNNTSVTNALNTRFDIYENGLVNYCAAADGKCSPAMNTRKDLIHLTFPADAPPSTPPGKGGSTTYASSNNCALQGTDPWTLPTVPYKADGTTPDNMGLPRDICHAGSSTGSCAGGRFGDGNWDRTLYFSVNHNGTAASVAQSWAGRSTLGQLSRYDVYKWEIATNRTASRQVSTSSQEHGQSGNVTITDMMSYSAPRCATGKAESAGPPEQKDRRILTAAVINCTANNIGGASSINSIGNLIDLFYVEPSLNRNYGGTPFTDAAQIYVEVIGAAERPMGAPAWQFYQRSQPRLLR